MAPDARTSEFLTAAQVAAEMKVSVDTVMRMLRSGRLPGRKFGKQWRIARSDLLRYVGGATRGDVAALKESPDEELLSPADLAAVREGIEAIRRGEYVTLEEYERQRGR